MDRTRSPLPKSSQYEVAEGTLNSSTSLSIVHSQNDSLLEEIAEQLKARNVLIKISASPDERSPRQGATERQNPQE